MDAGKTYVTKIQDFTSDPDKLISFINTVSKILIDSVNNHKTPNKCPPLII